MPYAIDRARLMLFVSDQVDVIESTPMPGEIRDVLPETCDDLTADDLHAVWLGAGLASQVGIALVDDPGRFLATQPRSAISA